MIKLRNLLGRLLIMLADVLPHVIKWVARQIKINKLKNKLFSFLVKFEGKVKAQNSLNIQQNIAEIRDSVKAKIKSWALPVKHCFRKIQV